MIDFRHKTFLEVCRLKNLTRAADALCITQPAVSQHIQYLEELYDVKLVLFQKRKFGLTEEGETLYKYLRTLEVDTKKIINKIQTRPRKATKLSFGATLSIGEYVMPSIINKLIKSNPMIEINMLVDNTKALLSKLEVGSIDFALIEGSFYKDAYDSITFSLEDFIGVCATSLNIKKKYRLEELSKFRLVTREEGSGTRMILEQILQENSRSIDFFQNKTEVGNIGAIKELVKSGLGIAFLYKPTVKREIEEGTLCEIDIENFKHRREFSFVYLKESHFSGIYLKYFDMLKKYHIDAMDNNI